MKKVFVNVSLDSEQKKRLESISDDLSFVYEKDYDAKIIIGNVPPADLKNYKDLEWIQTSAVGVDAYVKKGILNEKTVLTNAVDIHSQEVAEHAFAMMVELVKKLNLYHADQNRHQWTDEGRVREFSRMKAAVVGFGNIGKRLALLLKGLGIYVIGVKRTMIEKPDCLDELYTNAELEKAIRDVDVVFTVLPGTPENAHLFTLDTFKKMRPDAYLVNVGRGNLIAEDVLYEVLDQRIIAGLALDVFEKEPLPADSPLWDYEELIVTPHAAGFFHLESAFDAFLDLVEENLKRFVKGEQLKYVVTERG
jgi:phosphoglycerate dehydrogenase-like enzyme